MYTETDKHTWLTSSECSDITGLTVMTIPNEIRSTTTCVQIRILLQTLLLYMYVATVINIQYNG